MTTLHKVTDLSRKILAIGAMLLLGFLIIYFGIKIGFAIKETIAPTPPPPPTVAYGKLSPIQFPTIQNLPTFTYAINTVTGNFPDLGDRARVYKIIPPTPNLLALQNAKSKLLTVGFTQNPIALSDTVYSWTNADALPKTIAYNIQTNNFTLTSPYLTDPTVQAAANLPDTQHAITTAATFLSNIQNLPDDIDSNKTKTSLFAVANGQLISATSISTAQIIRVDFFQHNINSIPLYYGQPSSSPMHMLIASSDSSDGQIVDASFTHQQVSSDYATYPIKTAEEAYKDLQNGKAYIASFPAGITQITIRNISLGYFISDTQQPYLMPIIVFQGDNNFFAYVSAITDTWIGK